MTTISKVSLTSYLRAIAGVTEPEVIRALNELVGLPSAGSLETKQAESDVRNALPRLRNFSTAELIAAEMKLDHAGCYRWKYINKRRDYFLRHDFIGS